MNGSTKKNTGFILLLLLSWAAIFLVADNWFFLTYRLIIWANTQLTEGTTIEGSYVSIQGNFISLVYFIPFCFSLFFGFFLALLTQQKPISEKSSLASRIFPLKLIVWGVPAIVFALWLPMYLSCLYIPSRPAYFDGSYFPDFALNCGLVGGIVLGSFRNMPIDEIGSKRHLFYVALKTIFFTVMYYLLFFLSSLCVQLSIMKFYGYADYGIGAYWITMGNAVVFGAFFNVLFRSPRVFLRGRWVFYTGKSLAWIIVLTIVVILMGLMWEVFTTEFMPTFPSPRGRVPDIMVVWMYALGYLLGNNIEQKSDLEDKRGRQKGS